MPTSVLSEFRSGKFTVNKTGQTFSVIAIDQAQKQLNAAVKWDGGIIGLTENELHCIAGWLLLVKLKVDVSDSWLSDAQIFNSTSM